MHWNRYHLNKTGTFQMDKKSDDATDATFKVSFESSMFVFGVTECTTHDTWNTEKEVGSLDD